MKHIVRTLQSQTIRKWSLQTGILFMIIICCAVSAFGQAEEKITTIHVVTPSWEMYTNEDGSGAYFEVVRAVYEPLGITMTYEILPWKRARDKVILEKADALLGGSNNEEVLMPRFPLDFERTSVVFKKEHVKTWNGVQSLQGKNVVWLRGYDYHTDPKFAGIQCTWYEVDNYAQAWGMLRKDRVDFYMDALFDIEQYIEEHHIDMTPYRIETAWVTNTYMGLAKSQRSEKLIEIYDRRIPELLASGELQKIFEKWELELPLFKPEDE